MGEYLSPIVLVVSSRAKHRHHQIHNEPPEQVDRLIDERRSRRRPVYEVVIEHIPLVPTRTRRASAVVVFKAVARHFFSYESISANRWR